MRFINKFDLHGPKLTNKTISFLIIFFGWVVHTTLGAIAEKVLFLSHQQETAFVYIQAVRWNNLPAVAVNFETSSDLHFYADPDTAPSPDLILTISVNSEIVKFSTPLYPEQSVLFDSTLDKPIGVYSGNFSVVVPIDRSNSFDSMQMVDVFIQGIACTSQLCLPPFQKKLTATLDLPNWQTWPILDAPDLISRKIAAAKPITFSPSAATSGSAVLPSLMMYLLSIAAGLSFNVMPCVLPVLPLVLGRLTAQAAKNPRRRIGLGLAFCIGIVMFFAVVGAFSTLLRITTGAIFNLSDPYRYPAFNIAMASFLVLFALFLFDLAGIPLPQSIASKNVAGGTFSGSVGMGLLAGILSIPCSGAIVAAALIWTQTQPPLAALIVFLLMGIGMALPYAALVFAPAWLAFVPKPGAWMDILKKAIGFLLLILAVKPLSGLPKEQLLNTLTFLIMIAFAVWLVASWATPTASQGKKRLIRLSGVAFVIVAAIWLLPPKTPLIDWQPYQSGQIQQAIQRGQPVLIKFTADWCANCKILEQRVFSDPQIAAFMKEKNILAIKADTTLADMPAAIDLKKVYNIPGSVPMTVIHLPGKTNPIYLSGIYSKSQLIEAFRPLEP